MTRIAKTGPPELNIRPFTTLVLNLCPMLRIFRILHIDFCSRYVINPTMRKISPSTYKGVAEVFRDSRTTIFFAVE